MTNSGTASLTTEQEAANTCGFTFRRPQRYSREWQVRYAGQVIGMVTRDLSWWTATPAGAAGPLLYSDLANRGDVEYFGTRRAAADALLAAVR